MIHPKISVVMAVYNGERHLREAIDSILNQTFADFEFVIIDDASTDRSGRILQEYAGKDKRIVIIGNETNMGLSKSLNKGIRLTKGEYIARMDADDISFPDRFEKQVKFLDDHNDIGILGTHYLQMDIGGKDSREIFASPGQNDIF